MNRSSSAKKNHTNRFPYLIDLKVEENHHKKTQHSPQFNFNLCTENLCKNQMSQLELVNNDFTQQQIKRRKPPKIQLQSVNFQSFKRKVQQNSFPNSFLAYTPSKDSQNQNFTIQHQISTIECPLTKQIKTQRYEIPYDSGQELYYSGMKVSHSRQLSYIAPKTQDDGSYSSRFNEFIRLELSDTEKSSLQSSRQNPKNMNHTINQQFSTWGNVDITLTSGKKSARLSNIQLSHIDIKKPFESSIDQNYVQLMIPKRVTKKQSQQTIATVKTKQMSTRLSQTNQFQYEHSISWTPTSPKGLKTSEQTISTRSAIKLKGKIMKKS